MRNTLINRTYLLIASALPLVLAHQARGQATAPAKPATQEDITVVGTSPMLGTARLNPAIGATYRVAGWLTAYASYAEANRAPTPAELSCASAQNSCSLANFFVGDGTSGRLSLTRWKPG